MAASTSVATDPSALQGRIIPVLLSGVMTGFAVVVTRFALGDIPPMILSILRMVLGGVGLAAALIVMRRALPARPIAYVHMLVGGLIGVGVPVIGFTLTLQHLSSGVSSVFTSLIPLATAIIEFIWLKEMLTRVRYAGLGMAFGGAVVLILTRTTGLAEQPSDNLIVYVIALVAVAAGSFGAVYSRKMLSAVDPAVVGAGQSFAGMLAVIPFLLPELSVFNPEAVSSLSWLAALASGLIGSAVGYLIFLGVLQRHGATTASMAGYIVALSASILGALFLGEIITPIFLVGALLILGGVYFVSR